ncbi:MAG: hypothetical protein CSA20_03660 [Deltaproteobacteria bacterium]|nr:MAG: hypothetical protein CSA20_03660 [Deltaproteobacteria bacterium]
MLLNCDMGESFGNYTIGADSAVMPYIDMANIACGMHASDPQVMDATVALAVRHDVVVGAHPGYPDMQGFGRREMALSAVEIRNFVLYQVGALSGFCAAHGGQLTYIKPHGALYHAMMANSEVLDSLLQVAAQYKVRLMLLGTSLWQEHKQRADRYGVELLLEGFVDRGYEDDGSLVHRSKPGALLEEEEMMARVRALCSGKPISSVNGKALSFPIDTLCVHGDGKGVPLVKTFRALIDSNG